MKKLLVCLLSLCLLLSAGFAFASEDLPAGKLLPLPNTTIEELNDSTLSVALSKGDAYLDNDGMMRMTLQIYAYDLYDLVDVSMLKAGDTMVLCGEEIAVTSVEQSETGDILINGGLDADGFNLVTTGGGVYYAIDLSDANFWYLVGEISYPVSTEFTYTDSSDLDLEEPVVYYPGDFLTDDAGIDYFFIPNNTTVRVEDGVIVEMNRFYIP